MNSDLKEYFKKCELCNSYGQKQQKETSMSHEATDRPLEKIGVDLFELNNCNYLVTADYFSNFWEVDIDVNNHCCHYYGIPLVLVSNNGQQFSSQEFKTFVTE